MSYLAELVKTFTEEELKQFVFLDVIGKEENVRDAYAQLAREKTFDEATLAASLGLSDVHFRKIGSLLLDKIVERLWGDDYLKKFTDLQNRGLVDLVFHEIKIEEKRLLKTGDTEAISHYYKAVFDVLRAMFHPKYNSKLTHDYGKKYLASLGKKKRFEDEVEIEMMAINGDILSVRARGKESTEYPAIEKAFGRWQKRIAEQQNPMADMFFGLAKSNFHKYDEQPDKFSEAVAFALQGYSKAPAGQLPKRWEGLLRTEEAYGQLQHNRYEKAFSLYEGIMADLPDTYGQHIYHQYIHLVTAILSRKFEKARTLFQTYFLSRLRDDLMPMISFECYGLGLLLAIHERNTEEAEKWYRLLITVPTAQINDISKLMLRYYEVMYFYFSGERETASTLSAKNIKYFKSLPNGEKDYGLMFRPNDCIQKFLRVAQGEKKWIPQAEEAVKILYSGLQSLYHEPLRQEWELLKKQF